MLWAIRCIIATQCIQKPFLRANDEEEVAILLPFFFFLLSRSFSLFARTSVPVSLTWIQQFVSSYPHGPYSFSRRGGWGPDQALCLSGLCSWKLWRMWCAVCASFTQTSGSVEPVFSLCYRWGPLSPQCCASQSEKYNLIVSPFPVMAIHASLSVAKISLLLPSLLSSLLLLLLSVAMPV